MKRSLLAATISFATIGLWACGPSAPAAAPPRIAFQETTYDFGRTAQGKTVAHTFVFRNAGGLDLSIDNVRASCGCMATAPSVRVVAPGREAAIEARLDTAHDFGRKTRTITVYSNDPAQPVTTLSLAGDVNAMLAADPPELYVGHLRRGQVASSEVRLVVADSVAAGTTVGGTTASGGKVVDASLRAAATGTRLRVAIRSDAPLGRLRDVVTVRTNSPRQATLSIPVVGMVDASAAPAAQAERRE